jgi:hypothetical protein
MRTLLLSLLLLAPPPAPAQDALTLRLTLVHFPAGPWQEREIVDAADAAVKILAQCGIAPGGNSVLRAEAGPRDRVFDTPRSRQLALRLQAPTPAIYFVDDTRQTPAFEAEAIGRGNSASRPELRDTVWVVHGARDLPVLLAHELAHVLMNDGAHSAEAGNLMRDETTPANMRLNASQCARLRAAGSANGLLQPAR